MFSISVRPGIVGLPLLLYRSIQPCGFSRSVGRRWSGALRRTDRSHSVVGASPGASRGEWKFHLRWTGRPVQERGVSRKRPVPSGRCSCNDSKPECCEMRQGLRASTSARLSTSRTSSRRRGGAGRGRGRRPTKGPAAGTSPTGRGLSPASATCGSPAAPPRLPGHPRAPGT